MALVEGGGHRIERAEEYVDFWTERSGWSISSHLISLTFVRWFHQGAVFVYIYIYSFFYLFLNLIFGGEFNLCAIKRMEIADLSRQTMGMFSQVGAWLNLACNFIPHALISVDSASQRSVQRRAACCDGIITPHR